MKEYPDAFGDMNHIFDKVQLEHWKQLGKWGIQKRSLFEWMTYLTEEVGELAQAIAEYEYRDGKSIEIEKEGIQVAALACKIIYIMQPYINADTTTANTQEN
jgi:NTP pyrophosphatase (non-canonical NTP hydrolase)